jgi:hypothetical protein
MPTDAAPPEAQACTDETLRLHAHRCDACSHIWYHVRVPEWGEDQKVQAHTCPKCSFCGPRPWPIFRGHRPITQRPMPIEAQVSA